MKALEFDAIVENRLALIKRILLTKRAENAPEGGDRLHNFNRASALLDQTREQALMGMLAKHWVSLLDMIEGFALGRFPRIELIEEKIGDSINYLILLEAMMKEDIRKEVEK